jgi:hypothetical protein
MRPIFAISVITILLITALPAQAVIEEEEYIHNAVSQLTVPAMDGRASGSIGNRLASHFIATELQNMGAYPIGETKPGTLAANYFQYVNLTRDKQDFIGRNVIAWYPGTKAADLSQGFFLVSAHYDHIGPIITDGKETGYYPGANDNASGVAVTLALARRCSVLGQRLPYPVVFAFFDGEEIGFQGAKQFVKSSLLPLDKVLDINLDMVGIVKEETVLIACAAKPAAGSAEDMLAKLQEYAKPAGFTIKKMEQGWQSSDHYAFYEHGNPILFVFGGGMSDYDRTTDTADKLNYVDMMRLTAFLWDALSQMEPPSAYARVDMGQPSGIVAGGKRAFIGTIPDFAADVQGVKIAGTVPGSPADKAGLLEGDIIIFVNGMSVDDLESYSAILKDIKPGDRVDMTILRDGIEIKVSLIAAERGEG